LLSGDGNQHHHPSLDDEWTAMLGRMNFGDVEDVVVVVVVVGGRP
jgi:hypothetical protein